MHLDKSSVSVQIIFFLILASHHKADDLRIIRGVAIKKLWELDLGGFPLIMGPFYAFLGLYIRGRFVLGAETANTKYANQWHALTSQPPSTIVPICVDFGAQLGHVLPL